MEPIWAVGLMTGTVLDGNIDVALLKTDGETIAEFGPYTLAPYQKSIRVLLERALSEAREWNFGASEPGDLPRGRGRAHARAVGGGEGVRREGGDEAQPTSASSASTARACCIARRPRGRSARRASSATAS